MSRRRRGTPETPAFQPGRKLANQPTQLRARAARVAIARAVASHSAIVLADPPTRAPIGYVRSGRTSAIH